MNDVTLHVTNAYHATSGGVSTFYRALIEYANANARPMKLIVPGEQSRTEPVGAHAVIYHVKARRSPVADRRYRVLWPLSGELLDIVRAERPALIEISDKYTLPLLPAFLRKNWIRGVERPVLVATSHERMDDTTKAYFGAPVLWRAISRVFLRNYYFPMVDAHIANSAYTAGELMPASKGHRLHRNVHVLPMGVDALAFTPASRTPEARRALAERASVPECARLLLYVGRLGAEKNLPMLVRMMDCLPPQYHLVLAGDGPLAPLLRQVGELRRIRLIGHVQRDDIAALYAGADAFVHANSREPFGIAPLEAMAAGLPLVAPNAGGVLSYATPDNAWLAEPTPEAFADAVMQLWRTPLEEVRSRTAQARSTAEQHDWPIVAARYFALFDELITNRPCC